MSESKHTPGPWRVGYRALSIYAENAKIGGEAKLFDVRGWGYLTGNGHGGLGLPDAEAIAIQTANANLAAAAPDLLAALEFTRAEFDRWAAIRGGMGTYSEAAEKIDAALAKARS